MTVLSKADFLDSTAGTRFDVFINVWVALPNGANVDLQLFLNFQIGSPTLTTGSFCYLPL